MVSADDIIPLSVLSLDLDTPPAGWAAYLKGRGLEVVTDDIGRPSVSRADARQLITEKHEHERRVRELAERNEQRQIEADKLFRSQLSPGVPWWEVPPESTPAKAMLAAAKDESPGRRRSPLLDFVDNPDGGTVFHAIQSGGDES